MRIGVWTSDRELARETIERLEKSELDNDIRRIFSRSEIRVQDSHGNIIQWLNPSNRCRGYKTDKAYVDIKVSTDILHEVIIPCMWHGGFNDIVWIASDDITVYEYLRTCPQPLFEATLMKLIGVGMNEVQEAYFHNWMNSPYTKSFSEWEILTPYIDTKIPSNHMTMLLGKMASALPAKKQEQLKDAMKNYCEVCDYVNNQLTHEK